MDWQPIETAPKDGTAVLLYAMREGWDESAKAYGFSRVCGYYDGLSWSIYGAASGEPSPTRYRNIQRLDSCEPTHWMPLPEAPK